jgi:hypothetical protein
MSAKFENWYSSQPHHEALNDPTVWQFAFDAFKAGQISQSIQQTDYATIAGLEASVGHLSQMVDELRLLLGSSMDAMKEVEQNGCPIDESDGNIDCCVPYEHWNNFVDARAKLLYAIRHSAHHGLLETPFSSQTGEQS